MSMEQAKLFMERMAKDEAFRTKIMAVEDVAERMRLVKAEGYDCASEEIETMLEELSDATVEGASGGGWSWYGGKCSRVCWGPSR